MQVQGVDYFEFEIQPPHDTFQFQAAESTQPESEIVQPQHHDTEEISPNPTESQATLIRSEDEPRNDYQLVRDRERRVIKCPATFGVADLTKFLWQWLKMWKIQNQHPINRL